MRRRPTLLLTGAVLVILLVIACDGSGHEADKGETCGVERWPVKTLSDADAPKVNLTPVPVTVLELRSLTPPKPLPQSRIAPVELTTYALTAQVVEFKVEDDKDIHLVIADPANRATTMILEFPDAAACAGADQSAEAARMKSAREALIARYGQPRTDKFTPLTGTASFVGVGFFDFKHRQRGVAPNAIELHPVLEFTPAAPP